MPSPPLVSLNEKGLYCPAGDFFIDPWTPVPRAVITHAHGDHARWGSDRYLTAAPGRKLLQLRLGPEAAIDALPYGQSTSIGPVKLSFHPAGHILGAAQVRLEHAGQVCVVSGDYSTFVSPGVDPLEILRCHHFISECTFGLPIYRWQPASEIFAQIHDWWRSEQSKGRTCILLAYALGKAQRVLAGLDPSLGPILAHGAVLRLLPAHESQGFAFPPVAYAGLEQAKSTRGRALVLAPPSAAGSTWVRKFGSVSVAMASGWMQVRGVRRRQSLDRGFVLSDHADWPGLNATILATGAERIWLTHGSTLPMTRWLREQGIDAQSLQTQFSGEADEPDFTASLDQSDDAPPDAGAEAP